ncbi:hypothetical protein LEP1GSC081_1278 [Leptospira kirschneri str. H1]|uniref:Uncharacterized protein n=1 Tax=Leptospira kirschneri str. H1 TaxID=1049966 RepID=A0A0E2B6H0_9LEPT|nr:hypothetical protein LEP1GSC081_1278 [Leptospira kirschneri str. H1]
MSYSDSKIFFQLVRLVMVERSALVSPYRSLSRYALLTLKL